MSGEQQQGIGLAGAPNGGAMQAEESKLTCFMCGESLHGEKALDEHVILCAKGQLPWRDVQRPSPVEASLINTVTVVPVVSDPYSTSPRPKPPAPLLGSGQGQDASLDDAAPLTDDAFHSDLSSPPQEHADDDVSGVFASNDEGGRSGTPTGGDAQQLQATPGKQRRRRQAAPDEESAERRQRISRLAEAMQSLEELQQLNQERLRKAVQHSSNAASPGLLTSPVEDGGGDGHAVDSVSESSNLLSSSFGPSSRRSVTFSRHSHRSATDAQHTEAGASSPVLDVAEHNRPTALNGAQQPVGFTRRSPNNAATSTGRSVERSSSVSALPASPVGALKSPMAVQPYSRTRSLHTDPTQSLVAPLSENGHFDSSLRSGASTSRVAAGTRALASGPAPRSLAPRTQSIDARRKASSSPQPIQRRSSTVLGRRKDPPPANHPQPTDRAADMDLSADAQPRAGPPPVPMRAATAVRQRVAPATTTLHIHQSTTGGNSTSGFRTSPNISALLPSYPAAGKAAPLHQSSSRGAGGAPRAAGTTAAQSTIAAAQRTGSMSSLLPLFSGKSRSAAPEAAAVKPTRQQLQLSTGSVVVGSMPQPRHNALRAPGSVNNRKTTTNGSAASSSALTPSPAGVSLLHSSPPHANRSSLVPPPPRASSALTQQSSAASPDRSGSIAIEANFCAECGGRYVSQAKFCAYCGHRREILAGGGVSPGTS